jgi:hypothetical protein
MKNLEKCFTDAKEAGVRFVGIAVRIGDTTPDEIIINHHDNFAKKLEYYQNAYDENLCLKAKPEIKIVGFASGDSFAEIEKALI